MGSHKYTHVYKYQHLQNEKSPKYNAKSADLFMIHGCQDQDLKCAPAQLPNASKTW